MREEDLNSLLKELLDTARTAKSELEWLEFKDSNSDHVKIGEYISALANSALLNDKPFGYLIFGIKDKTFEVIGTQFSPNTQKVGNEPLEHWLTQKIRPKNFSFYEFENNQKRIVILEVSSATDRPVQFDNKEFIRIGETTHNLKDNPEKERQIWTKKVNFEMSIAKAGLTIDEVLELLAYTKYLELTSQPQTDEKVLIIDKLLQDKLIVKNRGKYQITQLGAILFAKDLTKFDNIRHKAPRVLVYKGKNKLEALKDIQGIKGYAVAFENLIKFIQSQIPLKEETHVKREVKEVYSVLILRELIANALIHQDFTITGMRVLVEIFEDRIEISNPGKPLIETLRFIDHSPQSRNEELTSFMRRINLCEERGIGIDRVVSECEKYNLPAPDFRTDDSFTKAILYSHKNFSDLTKEDRVRACFQHCCLKWLANEFMTNQSLRERLQIEAKNYPAVSRIIAIAMKEGFIKEKDPTNKSNKDRKYVPFWA